MTNESLQECLECKEKSPISQWRHIEVYCEDCGSHSGTICPKCEWIFDTVFDDLQYNEETYV